MGAISVCLWSAAFALVLCTLCRGETLCNGNATSFVTNFCSTNSGNALGYVVLETKEYTTWPADKFCQALADHPANIRDYVLTLQLFIDVGHDMDNHGYPGVAFNVKDSMNYDFIHFYVPRKTHCFTAGYVQYALHTIEAVSCQAPKTESRIWFTVQLHVADDSTSVFLDGVRVGTFPHHHKTVARGGVVIPNGFRNRVFFRGYRVTPWVPGSSQVEDCASHHQTSEYNTLNATSGRWPTFCRVLLGPGVDGIRYRISVDLYNVDGWRGINSGHLGVMYNVQDMINFDFVYFRPHSSSNCFQTGYVIGGHQKRNDAAPSTCANGVPVGGRWFHMEVHVDGSSAKIYRDGVLIYTAKTKLKTEGNGGVIVLNGYKNIVRYKNLRISA